MEFLKQMLELAQDTLKAEKQADPVEERDRAKEALTELFKEAKTKNTHIIVERIVADIDDIVKKVRFDGWKNTSQGERERYEQSPSPHPAQIQTAHGPGIVR